MKYLLKKVLILFALSLLPFMANAQAWVKIVETPELEYYVDRSSIKRNGSIVTYWTMHNKKLVTLMTQTTSDYSTKYKLIQDCKKEESKMVYLVSYDKPMGEGKSLEARSWDGPPTPNVPGSIGYLEMKYVCSSNRNTK